MTKKYDRKPLQIPSSEHKSESGEGKNNSNLFQDDAPLDSEVLHRYHPKNWPFETD